LKDLSRINADFYPKPIDEKPSQMAGVTNELVPVTDGFLNQEDFVHIYKKCGGMMHAANPYGSKLECIILKNHCLLGALS